jgi:hypothetical protein
MIRKERIAAHLDGEFVVFLIGMRINSALWRIAFRAQLVIHP